MRLLLRDEPIAAHRVVVLVKKAMAFASTSRSSRTTRSSRRIRENSSRSVVVSPSRWPLSISAWASQRWTLLSARPISRQTSAIDLPEWRISATVSDLNSLVNLRLERLSIQTNSIGASIPRFQMSVEVGQDHNSNGSNGTITLKSFAQLADVLDLDSLPPGPSEAVTADVAAIDEPFSAPQSITVVELGTSLPAPKDLASLIAQLADVSSGLETMARLDA